jgi:hypothetical protein
VGGDLVGEGEGKGSKLEVNDPVKWYYLACR